MAHNKDSLSILLQSLIISRFIDLCFFARPDLRETSHKASFVHIKRVQLHFICNWVTSLLSSIAFVTTLSSIGYLQRGKSRHLGGVYESSYHVQDQETDIHNQPDASRHLAARCQCSSTDSISYSRLASPLCVLSKSLKHLLPDATASDSSLCMLHTLSSNLLTNQASSLQFDLSHYNVSPCLTDR